MRMQQLAKLGSETFHMMVCRRSLDVFLEDIVRFHGFVSPVETYHCLPDAVQIFTPCTIGNGWLKIMDWDKFALTLYDKKKWGGYRVWFDLQKARFFPKIYDWYMQRVPKEDLPLDTLIEEILRARRSVLSYCAVRITGHFQGKGKKNIEICSGCGEAYSASQGAQCATCQGKGYYKRM
jgi:formylmethanofuran dehydrogenase subunit E